MSYLCTTGKLTRAVNTCGVLSSGELYAQAVSHLHAYTCLHMYAVVFFLYVRRNLWGVSGSCQKPLFLVLVLGKTKCLLGKAKCNISSLSCVLWVSTVLSHHYMALNKGT